MSFSKHPANMLKICSVLETVLLWHVLCSCELRGQIIDGTKTETAVRSKINFSVLETEISHIQSAAKTWSYQYSFLIFCWGRLYFFFFYIFLSFWSSFCFWSQSGMLVPALNLCCRVFILFCFF